MPSGLMRPNLLDWAIGAVAPAWAARRMRARALMAYGGYIGARYDRQATQLWTPMQESADVALLYDLWTLRNRSRDLARNAPIAAGAILTVVENVVGSGLSLQARPDAALLGLTDDQASAWAATAEREFRLWAESADCDLTRAQNFYQLQALIFRSALESGDCFVALPMAGAGNPYALRVQVIEADRVQNPPLAPINTTTLAAGVEMDTNGAPIAYHVRRKHPGSPEGWSDRSTVRVPAFGSRTGRRNVLHIFDRTRPGQTRGVPYLAPVIEPLKQLDRYSEAEVMAAVISSLFTVFVKTETGEGLPISNDATALPGNEIKLGNGAIVDLAAGEDVSFANPNRPNGAFDPFVQAVLRQVGVALGLPFEVLVKHFTASYSAARAALLEAWKFFRGRREFLASAFCQPVYEAWLEEAIALGRIDAPGFFADPALRLAYLRADWIGDSPGSIDPVKEVQAAQQRVALKVSTLAEETLLLTGGIWEEKHRAQVREAQVLARDGMSSPYSAAPSAAPPEAPPPDNAPPDSGGSDLENGKGGQNAA